ncbi:MAG: hypothetical protein ACKO2V_07745, partial [Snowella sp.]
NCSGLAAVPTIKASGFFTVPMSGRATRETRQVLVTWGSGAGVDNSHGSGMGLASVPGAAALG